MLKYNFKIVTLLVLVFLLVGVRYAFVDVFCKEDLNTVDFQIDDDDISKTYNNNSLTNKGAVEVNTESIETNKIILKSYYKEKQNIEKMIGEKMADMSKCIIINNYKVMKKVFANKTDNIPIVLTGKAYIKTEYTVDEKK